MDPLEDAANRAAPASETAVTCPNCGVKARAGARFCLRCGQQLPGGAPSIRFPAPEAAPTAHPAPALSAASARPAASPAPRARGSPFLIITAAVMGFLVLGGILFLSRGSAWAVLAGATPSSSAKPDGEAPIAGPVLTTTPGIQAAQPTASLQREPTLQASHTPTPTSPPSPTPSITPTATITLTSTLPPPTVVFRDNFCDGGLSAGLWETIGDPPVTVLPPEAGACPLRFITVDGVSSNMALKPPVSLSDGTIFQFRVWLDDGAPLDVLSFHWFEGETLPESLDEQGPLNLAFGGGRVRMKIATGPDGDDASAGKNVPGVGAHTFTIVIHDGSNVTVFMDGEAFIRFSEPLYRSEEKGRVVFTGAGQISAVEISFP